MEICGFIYGFEVRTGLSYRKARQTGSLFFGWVGHSSCCLRFLPDTSGSRSCFYEEIEIGEVVKLFFPDSQERCGRDGIV